MMSEVFLPYTHYLNRYLKQWVFNKYLLNTRKQWMKGSERLNGLLQTLSNHSTVPERITCLHPTVSPSSLKLLLSHMLSTGYVLHLPVSRLIWLPPTFTSHRDLSHSWVWSYCDSFLAMPVLSSFSPFVLAPSPPPSQTLCSFVYKCTSPNMPILPG